MSVLSKRKPVQLPEDIYWHLSGYAVVHGNLGLGEAIEYALSIADEQECQQHAIWLNGLIDKALEKYIQTGKGHSLRDYSEQVHEDGILGPHDINLRRAVVISRLRAMLKTGRIDVETLCSRIGDDMEHVLKPPR